MAQVGGVPANTNVLEWIHKYKVKEIRRREVTDLGHFQANDLIVATLAAWNVAVVAAQNASFVRRDLHPVIRVNDD